MPGEHCSGNGEHRYRNIKDRVRVLISGIFRGETLKPASKEYQHPTPLEPTPRERLKNSLAGNGHGQEVFRAISDHVSYLEAANQALAIREKIRRRKAAREGDRRYAEGIEIAEEMVRLYEQEEYHRELSVPHSPLRTIYDDYTYRAIARKKLLADLSDVRREIQRASLRLVPHETAQNIVSPTPVPRQDEVESS